MSSHNTSLLFYLMYKSDSNTEDDVRNATPHRSLLCTIKYTERGDVIRQNDTVLLLLRHEDVDRIPKPVSLVGLNKNFQLYP